MEAERLQNLLLEKEVDTEMCKKELEMQKAEIANLNQRISELIENSKGIDLNTYEAMKNELQNIESTLRENSMELESAKKLVSEKEAVIKKLEDKLSVCQSELDSKEKSVCSVDNKVTRKLNKTEKWVKTVEELKVQAGDQKKYPIIIDIYDDEKSSPLVSVEPGSESSECGWFIHGNKLTLTSGMKKYLKELSSRVLEIPFYICRMSESKLKIKGKMLLSASYVSEHLLSCLHEGVGYAHFELDGEHRATVTVKFRKEGRASFSSGWENVVAIRDIQVDDICAFHFKILDGVLKFSLYILCPTTGHLVK